jgi:hypothetical protein
LLRDIFMIARQVGLLQYTNDLMDNLG